MNYVGQATQSNFTLQLHKWEFRDFPTESSTNEFYSTSKFSNHTKQQECIAVRCVPFATVAVSGGGVYLEGLSA